MNMDESRLKEIQEYKAFYKELGLPSAPSGYYINDGWIDWYVFLGTEPRSLPSYEEAKRIDKAPTVNFSDEKKEK